MTNIPPDWLDKIDFSGVGGAMQDMGDAWRKVGLIKWSVRGFDDVVESLKKHEVMMESKQDSLDASVERILAGIKTPPLASAIGKEGHTRNTGDGLSLANLKDAMQSLPSAFDPRQMAREAGVRRAIEDQTAKALGITIRRCQTLRGSLESARQALVWQSFCVYRESDR